ncbi:MAG: ATP-dependent DNA ligase [Parvibaculaceae bacterium]
MRHNFVLPTDIEPMEAKPSDYIPHDGGPWQYEPKWDGFRCLAFKEGDAVDLRAKSGKSLARYFPEITTSLRNARPQRFVVDGELVIETGAVLSFSALQMRLHPAESRIRKLSADTPAKLILFDILAAKDSPLAEPLTRRRAALEALVARMNRRDIVLSPYTRDIATAEKWFNDSGAGSTDGVIAKRLSEPYQPGQRVMVKVKKLRTADCVVGGFRYLNNKHEVGSLLLGLYNEKGELDHVGFTSTIPNSERPFLTNKLEAKRAPPGFTGKAPGGPSRWSNERSGAWEPVEPKFVVEVCFDHVTSDRFRHGAKLLRWRPDKAPEQCTLDQIRTLNRSHKLLP